MRFEIECKDLDKAENILNEFAEMCEKEYSKKIQSIKEKLRAFSKIGIVRKDYIIPEEVVFLVQREEDKLIFRNSIPLPFVLKFSRRPIKKMEKNLRGFLEANGIEVYDVRYAGD